MKYSISRKINLGKFGIPFESIDLTVEDCASWEEAEKEITAEHQKLINLFTPHLKARIDWLDNKIKLTLNEERERQELKNALSDLPF